LHHRILQVGPQRVPTAFLWRFGMVKQRNDLAGHFGIQLFQPAGRGITREQPVENVRKITGLRWCGQHSRNQP